MRRRQDEAMDFPRLLGGRLCLDFANTIEDPHGEAVDFLHDTPALELLTDGDLTRVRECPDSRRWCSMEGCGSRAKMRRYYARSKQAGAS